MSLHKIHFTPYIFSILSHLVRPFDKVHKKSVEVTKTRPDYISKLFQEYRQEILSRVSLLCRRLNLPLSGVISFLYETLKNYSVP